MTDRITTPPWTDPADLDERLVAEIDGLVREPGRVTTYTITHEAGKGWTGTLWTEDAEDVATTDVFATRDEALSDLFSRLTMWRDEWLESMAEADDLAEEWRDYGLGG